MNCKRQSHDGKYICGLPTVRTCYAFAVVNFIIVSLSSLGFLGWLGLLLYLSVNFGVGRNDDLLVAMLVSAAGYLASAISAIFGMLLLVGIRKKIPTLVKAYLFYGFVVEILLILAAVVFIAVYSYKIFRGYGWAIYVYFVIVCCICVLYGFILLVVVNTYVVLRNGHSWRGHRTDVQVLFMMGTDGELQLLPLVR